MKITLQNFYNDFPIGKACIHCETEDQAIKLLQEFHRIGKTWIIGRSYLKETSWESYKSDTVYYNDGMFADIGYAVRNKDVVIKFEDVIFAVEKLTEFIRSIR